MKCKVHGCGRMKKEHPTIGKEFNMYCEYFQREEILHEITMTGDSDSRWNKSEAGIPNFSLRW